jgi:benzoyl-CoA reductase/2-hydroxyglutaryl-CoA dehydratase subunit BcrC/BadD/HgdB
MIWTACKYAPVELLAGFGEETQRLDPSPESFSCGDACAHPNLCSFAKALIEEVHEKGIRELVLTDCCDSTRRAYGVLKKQEGIDFIWLLPLPHKNGPAEVRLFAEDLKKLTEAYEKYSGKTLDLTRAVQAYREQRTHAPVMPKGKYVLIKGAHGGKRLVEDVRKTFGSVPVVNDTCSGNRYLRAEAGEEKNFFAWYAEALLDQEKPCMRMWRYGGRNDMDHQPAGMIFHTIKFCDYYGFEYVLEKKNTAGPLLKIESDTTAQAEGQLKTRLEAFREELGI